MIARLSPLPVLAPVLAGCLLLTACGSDPETTATGATPGAAPTSTAQAPDAPATAAPTTPPAPAAPEPDGPPFGGTGPVQQESTGGPLTVTTVRVARQDGFDRVVFELAGQRAGEPGWTVRYVDDPRKQGSGDPAEVASAATLQVGITGVGYPFDTGVEQEASRPTVPGDLELVEEVAVGAVYEGNFEAFIGISREAPFRVFRLADPARVVVDVRHG